MSLDFEFSKTILRLSFLVSFLLTTNFCFSLGIGPRLKSQEFRAHVVDALLFAMLAGWWAVLTQQFTFSPNFIEMYVLESVRN